MIVKWTLNLQQYLQRSKWQPKNKSKKKKPIQHFMLQGAGYADLLYGRTSYAVIKKHV